ncbi:MAG: RHS repeat-associated core domain-containing protein [Verrucomicrobiota bacterium]|nr:RHS repeat-associated core domain-containing protein [Verrucomicrobiota bacterium]
MTYHTDGNGNIEQVDRHEDGAIYTDFFEFDDLDNRTAARDSFGELSRYVPRADGTWREVINPRGNHTSLEHSALGELLLQRREDGMEMRFRHNEHRQLTYAGDPTSDFVHRYDSYFRLAEQTLRDGSTISHGKFDPRDLPQEIRTPGGVTEQHYDRLRRLCTQRVTHQGTSYEWRADYDALDRARELTWQQDGGPENTSSFSYDLAWPLLSARYQEDGKDFTVGYTYYNDLSRRSISYPSGVVVTEERDASGRLIGLSDASGVIWRAESWQGNTEPKLVQIGPNIMAAHQYDARGRLTGSRYTRRDNGAVLAHLRYSYDPAGNVEIRRFVHRGAMLESFVHDKGERVSRAAFGVLLLTDGGFTLPQYERSYTYEQTGLDYLVSVATTGPLAATAPVFASAWTAHDAFLAPAEIDGFSYQTDPVGNLKRVRLAVRPAGAQQTQAIGATLSHNGLGQLVKIERDDGVVIENRFQPTGLRHAKWIKENGHNSERSYVYDEGGRLLEEYETVNSTTRLIGRFYYFSSDAPVAADLLIGNDQLRRFYYIKDVAESVVAVADASGKVVERISYDTFGQPAIEAADTAAPRIRRILTGQNADLLIEFSEPVLPAVPDPGLATGIVPVNLSASVLAQAITVSTGTPPVQVPGTNQLLIELSGFAPRSVIRFATGQMVTGQVRVILAAGTLADDWGNSNAVQSIVFTNSNPALPAGTVLFEETADTAPSVAARSTVGSPFLFQGQYFDYETGLLYLRARFYDPFSGMFLEPDPLGYEESVNHYATFANNPVSRRAPSGLTTNPLVWLARKQVLQRNPNLLNTVGNMDIDALVQAGGYQTRRALFADVFSRMKNDPAPLHKELRAAVRRGEIEPYKGRLTPFKDKNRWEGREFDDVRAELDLRGFVKVKDSRTIMVNGMAKTDGCGGSEIWMRIHVRAKGSITGAECVRIDELGNPCLNPKLRDLELPDATVPGGKVKVMAGEIPHYHAEYVERAGEFWDYLETGLQKPNPMHGQKHPAFSGGNVPDTRVMVYDTPRTYNDAGKLLMRRGQAQTPAKFFERSHIRAKLNLPPSAYLTP